MPVFQYRALQSDGSVAVGEIEAGGRQEAFRQMEGQGLRPIRLAQRNGNDSHKTAAPKKSSTDSAPQSREEKSSGLNLSLGGSTRISGRMLENFTRLLSSLLAAGVPL